MIEIPLGKGGSVNLDDAVLDQSFGPHELVVGCIIDNIENSGFTGDSFRSPVEVALLKPERSKFVVSSSDSNPTNSSNIADKFGIRYGSSLFESSLLLMNRHASTCESSFMS